MTNEASLLAALRDHHKFSFDKRNARLPAGAPVASLGPAPAINGMDVARYCYDAGWHDVENLARALGTSISESAWHPEAFHHNVDTDGNIASTDWGMWQINDQSHPEFFPGGDTSAAFDPAKSTRKAFDIWKSWGGFNAWFGFKNQVYLDDYYLRRVWLAMANFGARDWVKLAMERPGVIAGRNTPSTKTRVPMISLSQFRIIYPSGT